MSEYILDMDDTGNVVERIPADRQAAVIGGRHLSDDFREAFRQADRNNVGARDHHIRSIEILKAKNIAKKGFLVMVKTGLISGRVSQQIFQLVATRGWLVQSRKNE